jgi:hypothetical protein
MIKKMEKTTKMQGRKVEEISLWLPKKLSDKSKRTRMKIIMFIHLFRNSFPSSSLLQMEVRK